MRAGWADDVAAVIRVIEQHSAKADAAACFPVEALSALRARVLLGLLVPVEHGGRGGDLDDLVDVTAELGRADLSVAMIFAMHCQQVAVVDRYASGPFRDRVLRSVAAGELYLASVTTDRHSGGSVGRVESSTDRDGRLIHIDRDAPIVTGGAHADAFLVTVQQPSGAARPRSRSCMPRGTRCRPRSTGTGTRSGCAPPRACQCG